MEQKINDYNKENPSILCPRCKEHYFRKYGIDRKGNDRIYSQCMICTMEDFNKQTKSYNK
jgi:transposase-like protein